MYKASAISVCIAAAVLTAACGYYTLNMPVPGEINREEPADMALSIRTGANIPRPTLENKTPVGLTEFDAAAQDFFISYFRRTGLFREVVEGGAGDIDLQIVITRITNDIKNFGGLRSVNSYFKANIETRYYIINKIKPNLSKNGELTGSGYAEISGEPGIAEYQDVHSQALSGIAEELYFMLKADTAGRALPEPMERKPVENKTDNSETESNEPSEEKKDENDNRGWVPIKPE